MSNTGFGLQVFKLRRILHHSAAVGFIATLAGGLAAAEVEPLNIGSARQVFLDGRFMAEARNVTLEVHSPRKTGEWTIKPEHPWERGGVGPYSNVLHDGQTYHFWYHVMDDVQWDQGHTNGCICYARSQDGIHWEKPALGLIAYGGSRSNNIVVGHGASGLTLGQDGGMVFLDPTAESAERFRLVCRFGSLGRGLHILSSSDGIHWRVTHKSIVSYRADDNRHHLDSQNIMFWDDRIRKYVVYGRRNMFEGGVQGRAVARAESEQLGAFSGVQEMPVVIGPEPGDRWVDYYSSSALKYPWAQDAYYMFPQAYFHYLGGEIPEFPKQTPANAGPLHTQFAASRDGIKWNRYDRRPFVRLGMRGEFDWASVRMMHGLVPDTTGREMYLYYRASDWLHGWDRNANNKRLLTEAGLGADRNIAVVSRVVLRRDGFVSAYAPWTGGEFTTEPLLFEGRKLVLNVDTSAEGTLRVALLDGEGKAIEGLGLKDCDFIHTANEINRVVKWKGNADVSRLAGKAIRLRFALKNTHLYAFQFARE
ncbi:MAG TPA: hypothetical protein P5205_15695 [Candidatus Paceibacterota bacterium]|nr:hypothetical protein [Verrucomicrobiota bacterium]HSA11804.1 hypothetical protein [Candidatus Paceibacterota bacterium]